MNLLPPFFLLLLLAMVPASRLPAAEVQVLEQAWFNDAPSPMPPADVQPGWRQVRLPDSWFDNHGDDRFPAWYRFEFQVDPDSLQPARLWAVYLPAVNSNAEVWLNGNRIGDGGDMTPGRVASNWHRPLYFPLGQRLLQAGRNTLFIRLMPKQSRFGYLWPVQVGPDVLLRPRYETKRFFKVTLIGVSALLLAAFALFLFLIWWMRRKESLYAWFAAGSLAWAIFVFDMVLQPALLPERLRDTLVFAAVGWMVIFMSFFFHRFYGIARPRLEKAMLVFGLLGTLALYLAGDRHFYVFASFVWDNLLIAFSLYLIWVITRQTLRRPSLENRLLTLAAGIVVLFGGHDNLVQMGLLDLDHTHLLPYGAPFLVGVLIWMLARRFGQALQESEALNQELDRRVKEKIGELETSYQRLRHSEREKVLAQERERIMRDMHDGTGGHLVSALALIHQEPVNRQVLDETLQQALDDLRLMIDSLDSVDEDLLVVLGMFRSRIEPRLNDSGIGIRWQVEELPVVPGLGPEKVLQLMRILQEIITNIVKHAGADTITFVTGRLDPDWIFIEVRDNGRGFPARRREGRGMANLRHRAAQIGARLIMENHPQGGACVRLLLPLNPAAGPATEQD